MPKILGRYDGSDSSPIAQFKEGSQAIPPGGLLHPAGHALVRMDSPDDHRSDVAAQRTFAKYLELGHRYGVPVVPVVRYGQQRTELMAENAAIWCTRSSSGRRETRCALSLW